jgi:DNA-binding NarL/FixJ family response regulator
VPAVVVAALVPFVVPLVAVVPVADEVRVSVLEPVGAVAVVSAVVVVAASVVPLVDVVPVAVEVSESVVEPDPLLVAVASVALVPDPVPVDAAVVASAVLVDDVPLVEVVPVVVASVVWVASLVEDVPLVEVVPVVVASVVCVASVELAAVVPVVASLVEAVVLVEAVASAVDVVPEVEAVAVDVSVAVEVVAVESDAVAVEAVSVVDAAVVVPSVVAVVVEVGSVVVVPVGKVPLLSLTSASLESSLSTGRFPQPDVPGTQETTRFVWIDFLRERSQPEARTSGRGTSNDVGGGRPILIVDADASARAELAHLLEEEGYDVVQAGSGEAGLKVARETPPALVVLEVPLGDRSGYEVCRVLREELGEELPVLFLSGARTESYDRVAGLLVGADDYVVKPFAVDELLARVRRLVRHASPAAETSMAMLTPREREVLRLLAAGLAADDIAKELFISKKTVGTHLEHIFTKLGVRSRAQAIAVAYRDELVARQ